MQKRKEFSFIEQFSALKAPIEKALSTVSQLLIFNFQFSIFNF